MRWRLIRRCLIFGLLGLVTSVAIAWGVSLRRQAGFGSSRVVAIGSAFEHGRPLGLFVRCGFGVQVEEWLIGAPRALDQQQSERLRPSLVRLYRAFAEVGAAIEGPYAPPAADADERAANGPPVRLCNLAGERSEIRCESAGWPAPALRSTQQRDIYGRDRDELGMPASFESKITLRSAIEIPWPWRIAVPATITPETIALPLAPRPGLLLNTIFYGLLWAMLLLAPRAIRRRNRRARGRCPKCGYLLRGQPAPGCPECGAGREGVAKWPSGEVAK